MTPRTRLSIVQVQSSGIKQVARTGLITILHMDTVKMKLIAWNLVYWPPVDKYIEVSG